MSTISIWPSKAGGFRVAGKCRLALGPSPARTRCRAGVRLQENRFRFLTPAGHRKRGIRMDDKDVIAIMIEECAEGAS